MGENTYQVDMFPIQSTQQLLSLLKAKLGAKRQMGRSRREKASQEESTRAPTFPVSAVLRAHCSGNLSTRLPTTSTLQL